MNASSKPALNVQNFPKPLHQRFKALCALNNLSLRQGTIQAVEMWVKAHLDSGVAALPGREDELNGAMQSRRRK